MSTDIHALSGAYAVDALDDDERIEFEKHLAGCPTCRAEVDGLREAASTLAGAVALDPPAELRGRVLAAAATIRPAAPRLGSRRAPNLPRRWPVLLAAAAATVVVGVGAVAWQPWHDDTTSVVVGPIEQVVQADDVERHRLVNPDGSVIVVYRSPSLDRAVVRTEDMAPAPPGHVYELWLQDDAGAMQPAGLMDGADASVLVEEGAASAQGIGVTVEPAGGSAAPTSDPIALIEFGSA